MSDPAGLTSLGRAVSVAQTVRFREGAAVGRITPHKGERQMPPRMRNTTRFFIIRLTAVVMALGWTAAALAQPADVAALKAKALATGQVSVIVTLDVPAAGGFQPEGHLSLPEVAQQRQAIATARQTFLSSLSGLNAQEYR